MASSLADVRTRAWCRTCARGSSVAVMAVVMAAGPCDHVRMDSAVSEQGPWRRLLRGMENYGWPRLMAFLASRRLKVWEHFRT